MIYRGNVFANLTAAPGVVLDTSINSMTASTLAHSGSLAPWKQYAFDQGPLSGWPPLSLDDPVIKELDFNTYYGVQGYNTSLLSPHGWDLHASSASPMLAGETNGALPWTRSCADVVPEPASPVYRRGFLPINASSIGIDAASFPWMSSALLVRDASHKIQAERYQRMHGLWRLGSFCVTGSSAAGFAFGSPAWARYDRIKLDCPNPCTVSVRFRSDATAPRDIRHMSFGVASPQAHDAVVNLTVGPTSSWTVINATVPPGMNLNHDSVTLYMTLDGAADVDYFWFHSP